MIYIVAAVIIGWFGGVFRSVPNPKVTKGMITGLADGKEKVDPNEEDTLYINREEIQEPEWSDLWYRYIYKAIVVYEVNGKVYTIKSKHYSRSFGVGKTVKIIYDELEPQNAIVKAGLMTYIITSLLFVYGIVMMIDTALLIF